jgi:hypothetical protein
LKLVLEVEQQHVFIAGLPQGQSIQHFGRVGALRSVPVQVTFQPFACKLLDTLQRISFYTLQITLFLLMIASFDEISNDDARLALLAVGAFLNAAVLALFVFFIGRGLMLMSSRFDW